MDHQTKMSVQDGSPETASTAMARDAGEFADGLVTLAALQARLFVADLKEFGQRALVPGLVLLGGVAMGLACFPIALAALALLLNQVFDMSYAAGFIVAAGTGAVLSVPLCVIGWLQVRQQVAVLRRSQQELVRNLAWVTKVLQRKRLTRTNSFDNSWRTVR